MIQEDEWWGTPHLSLFTVNQSISLTSIKFLGGTRGCHTPLVPFSEVGEWWCGIMFVNSGGSILGELLTSSHLFTPGGPFSILHSPRRPQRGVTPFSMEKQSYWLLFFLILHSLRTHSPTSKKVWQPLLSSLHMWTLYLWAIHKTSGSCMEVWTSQLTHPCLFVYFDKFGQVCSNSSSNYVVSV